MQAPLPTAEDVFTGAPSASSRSMEPNITLAEEVFKALGFVDRDGMVKPKRDKFGRTAGFSVRRDGRHAFALPDEEKLLAREFEMMKRLVVCDVCGFGSAAGTLVRADAGPVRAYAHKQCLKQPEPALAAA